MDTELSINFKVDCLKLKFTINKETKIIVLTIENGILELIPSGQGFLTVNDNHTITEEGIDSIKYPGTELLRKILDSGCTIYRKVNDLFSKCNYIENDYFDFKNNINYYKIGNKEKNDIFYHNHKSIDTYKTAGLDANYILLNVIIGNIWPREKSTNFKFDLDDNNNVLSIFHDELHLVKLLIANGKFELEAKSGCLLRGGCFTITSSSFIINKKCYNLDLSKFLHDLYDLGLIVSIKIDKNTTIEYMKNTNKLEKCIIKLIINDDTTEQVYIYDKPSERKFEKDFGVMYEKKLADYFLYCNY